MYTDGIQLGKAGILLTSKRGGGYERKITPVILEHRVWLERFEQDYTAEEKQTINDPYAEGWEFAKSGGELWKLPTDLNIHGKGGGERRRLFRLGFKDGVEYMDARAAI